MRLLIVNRDISRFDAGDILYVFPDSQVMGNRETMERWIANGGAEQDFPNPQFSVVTLAGIPADKNLSESEIVHRPLPDDPNNHDRSLARGWYLDLDQMSPPTKAAVEEPGAEVDLMPGQARAWIKRKRDGMALPVRVTGNGETRDRHPDTQCERGKLTGSPRRVDR